MVVSASLTLDPSWQQDTGECWLGWLERTTAGPEAVTTPKTRESLCLVLISVSKTKRASLLCIISTLRYQTRLLLPGAPLTWKVASLQSHLFQKDDLSPNLWLWYIAGRTQLRASFCILSDINADRWQGLEPYFSESSKQNKREIGVFFWGKREGRDSRWHGRRFRVGARSDVMEAVFCLWTPR